MMTETIKDIFNQPVSLTNYLCNWSKSYKYIYMETPKVACTTIKRIIQQAEVEGILSYENVEVVHDRDRSPMLSPKDDIDSFVRALVDNEYFIFCFVRNPFTRSLSCYLDKMVNTEFERRRLAPRLDLNPDTPPSFISFLEAVAEQSDEECDIHWASQTFLLRPNRIRYSFIGRFELFRQQFGMVCDRLKISEYANDLSDTWHATNAYQKVRRYMGKKEVELIQKIYERDFRNFGYGWSPEII